MIPIRLAMRNFMCYRDNVPVLDFTGIHLACLSGDNGNGKSALIDAMTWALWGKARASSDDDLIHANQMDMEVEFEFAVGQQIYRIIRKHSRPKRRGSSGQSDLQLHIKNADGFRSITGNNATQTQRQITNDILHMDYDTFINSAYLRQGHADEFTRQAPARRKEVLGNIIGLDLYDELEERAKELAKLQETEKAQLESSIRDINDEIAQKPAFEAELIKEQRQLSLLESAAREKEAGLNELRKKKEALQNRKTQLDELDRRISHDVKELARWDEQVRQHHSRIKAYEEVIGRREDIEEGYTRFIGVKKVNEELEKRFHQKYNLEKKRNDLDKKIQAALNNLKTEHTLTQSKMSELEARSQKLPELKKQFHKVQMQISQLDEQDSQIKQKKEAERELQAGVNHLEAEITRLNREIGELKEKIDLISSQTEAKCPLCETELSFEGLKLISSKYINEKQNKSVLLASHQDELVNRRKELELHHKEISQIDSRLNQEKAKAQGLANLLVREIAEVEEANKQLADLRETLSEIELNLAKRDFATGEQEALAVVETELASLDYDSEKYEMARQQLHQLEPYDQDYRRLEEADRLIGPEKETVARAEEAAQGLRHSLELDRQKQEEFSVEITQFPQVLRDLTTSESEYQSLTAQRSQAQEMVGKIKARIQRCTELEIKKKEKEEETARVAKEQGIYKELAEAFGKKGIQALIIETVLPEIEAEANRLLARMTDNRMHVRFVAQEETRTGSVRETLAIYIADELGTRNYEMFSGGEAFRINFAIRIALSKLLARRAGAPLPTLIIDEGFGTQDSSGMEKLKEAINSIKDDFNKVLVITHMEEMRDAFPTRIDVIKTAEGSTISIN